jgi:hypothetical protein
MSRELAVESKDGTKKRGMGSGVLGVGKNTAPIPHSQFPISNVVFDGMKIELL